MQRAICLPVLFFVSIAGNGAARADGPTMELVPVRASGVQNVDWQLGPGPNDITVHTPGQTIEFDLLMYGWSPEEVTTYQASLDCGSFYTDGARVLDPVLLRCENAGPGEFCQGVDVDRPDFVFAGLTTISLCDINTACADGSPGLIRCGSTTLFSSQPDDGAAHYAATYAVAHTVGPATLTLDTDPDLTFITLATTENVLPALVPANVIHACQTDADCDDGLACTQETCDTAEGTCTSVVSPGYCAILGTCYSHGESSPDLACRRCDTAANDRYWSIAPFGTSCGDQTDTACTDPDTCDAGGNCESNHAAWAECDDGVFCNGNDVCSDSGYCSWHGVDPCAASGQLCDETTDSCVECLTDTDCDDGLYCTGTETCVAGVCQSGTAVDCDDTIDCTDDSCNDATESCDNLANDANCDDGNDCTEDVCSHGICVNTRLPAGTACGDPTDDLCTAPDACDGDGRCLNNHAPDGTTCGDTLFCNGTEACASGACQPGTDPCPASLCDEDTDACVECLTDTDCDDGSACTLDVCASGICEHSATCLYVDDDATGGGDGSTWCDAFNHLQDALSTARASGGGVIEIRIAQGTYWPDQGGGQTPGDPEATFELIGGVAMYGDYAGCGAADPDLRDPALFETSLSGDRPYPGRSYHVVTGVDLAPGTLVDGVTVTKGGARFESDGQRNGGGMHLTGGELTLRQCRIRNNSASTWSYYVRGHGAGIYAEDVSLLLDECIFTENATLTIYNVPGSGAGIYQSGGTLTIVASHFSDNSIGKMYCTPQEPLSDCSTPYIVAGGSAIYLANGTLHVSDSVFRDNIQTGWPHSSRNLSRGAIWCDHAAVMITDCEFTGNHAGKGPGGAFSSYQSNVEIHRGSFVDNSADGGGAVAFECDELGGSAIIADSVFQSNQTPTGRHCGYAGGSGGAILSECDLTLLDSTVILNSTGDGEASDWCCCGPMNPYINDIGGDGGFGGGLCLTADAHIARCDISHNTTGNSYRAFNWSGVGGFGGGISATGGAIEVIDSRLVGNRTGSGESPSYDGDLTGGRGGGISVRQSDATIHNCLIANNETGTGGYSPVLGARGAGIYADADTSLAVYGSTVAGNASGSGENPQTGGIHHDAATNASFVVRDAIVFDNVAGQISAGGTVTYSDVDGGADGVGNIDADPMFVPGPWGCFYLSQIESGQAVDSPCVDAGSDLAANLGLNGRTTRTDEVTDAGIVDMGYHYPVTGITAPVRDCTECFVDADCADGLFCTGSDYCDLGNCTHGGDPCAASALFCDETTDSCVECLTDADCSDDDACTDDVCTVGECANPEVSAQPPLIATDPPDGAIDARQPFDPDGTNPAGWQSILWSFSEPVAALDPAQFVVTEIGGDGTPPSVIVAESPDNLTYTLTLSEPIEVLAWTDLLYPPGCQHMRIGYLPGDVSGNGVSDPSDIIAVIDAINEVTPAPLYSADVDRNGVVEPSDIVHVIDLLNGMGAYPSFYNARLP